jgi:hypothetical protein
LPYTETGAPTIRIRMLVSDPTIGNRRRGEETVIPKERTVKQRRNHRTPPVQSKPDPTASIG